MGATKLLGKIVLTFIVFSFLFTSMPYSYALESRNMLRLPLQFRTKTQTEGLNNAKEVLSEGDEKRIFKLNGKFVGQGKNGATLLMALLDLGWLNLPFLEYKGENGDIYEFALKRKKEINMIAFKAGYVLANTGGFFRKVAELEESGKKAVVITGYDSEKEWLEKNDKIKQKLGKTIFIVKLGKDDYEANQQWRRLLSLRQLFFEKDYYNLEKISIANIINSRYFILAIAGSL